MVTKLLRLLTVAIVLILTAGSINAQAQQLPSNKLYDKVLEALASGVEKSIPNTQSQSHQTNVSFSKDLNTLKMGDELTMTISIMNTSSEPITGFGTIVNFPLPINGGPPGKNAPDMTDIYYGYNFSIGDFFGIKDVEFSHGQFYNSPLFGINKQADLSDHGDQVNDNPEGYGIGAFNGIPPLLVWLIDETTKNSTIAPGETAILQLTLIAEMPTDYDFKKAVNGDQANSESYYPFNFNTLIFSFEDGLSSYYQSDYIINTPDEDLPPVSFYMTSFGLESSDAGNTAGYYLTIVNRDMSSTLLLDMEAMMPQDFFVEFIKSFGYSNPPALGFSTYHSFYSMFNPFGPLIPVKLSEGSTSGDTQLNGYSSYPAFNYALFQAAAQPNLQMSLIKNDYCIYKTASVEGIECPGIVMPPGIMTIFIQGTPMPNGNGTTMTMDAQLEFIDAYEFEPPQMNPPPPPPKAVALDKVDEHYESIFPMNDSASFDVSPIMVTYDVLSDNCPVNGNEIGYVMTVQGIDYPRLPGHFSIFQQVDDKQDVTLVDLQRPIFLDPEIPSTTTFSQNLGINGGLWYAYERFSSYPTKAATASTQDHDLPPFEEWVTQYVNSFQVLVNADVSTSDNAMALSEARLTHYLDLSYYYLEIGKAVSQGSIDHEEFEVPSYVPDGFIFDLMFNSEVEVNCLPDISGVKYLDVNGNGTRDDGEPGLAGVTIRLVDDKGQEIATTVTAQDGTYQFDDVAIGQYAIWEVLPDGYGQSEPGVDQPSFHYLVAQPGVDRTGLNFGNYLFSGVKVIVFHDDNKNGMMDQGESPIPNWSVGIKNTITDATHDGNTGANGYLLRNTIRPGNYVVTAALPEFWLATGLDEPLSVQVLHGETTTVYIARYFDSLTAPEPTLGSIRGSVFGDGNATSSWQFPTEKGLVGRTVVLTGMTERGIELSMTTTTDNDGRYLFDKLPAGIYTVSHPSNSGLGTVWPVGGSHVVRLGEAEHIGEWASGGPNTSGWLLTAPTGEDRTFATLILGLDLDNNGTADTRWMLSGEAELALGNELTYPMRSLTLQRMDLYGMSSENMLISTTLPGLINNGGQLVETGAIADQTLEMGLVINMQGNILMAADGILFEGSADRWPIRHSRSLFNALASGTSVPLIDVNGNPAGTILYAELMPTYGVDFGAQRADFGDAPDSYGTLSAQPFDVFVLTSSGIQFPGDGARHLLPFTGSATPMLGTGVTADADGMPSPLADSDADDGVDLPDAVAPGQTFSAEVTVSGTGKLSVWMDWNRNGVFDVDERIVHNVAVGQDASPVDLTFQVPTGVSDGPVLTRFRIGTGDVSSPKGILLDGEVEDYVITVDGSIAGGGGGLPTNDPDANAGVPTEFRLIGAWPNPFNPTTNISFDLPEAATVRVEVVDMLGRQVMSLAPRTMGSGANRTITLDAAKLSSGVYIYRVVAESATQTFVQGGKFTLVK